MKSSMLVDDDANYPLFNFASNIQEVITERKNKEGLEFQDLTKEQLAIKLGNHISKIQNIMTTEYPQSKDNLLEVATDVYCLLSQIEFDEKEKSLE